MIGTNENSQTPEKRTQVEVKTNRGQEDLLGRFRGGGLGLVWEKIT